jgi:NADPH-dependent glutamate synthase beta subunit-like oxidoreductase/dihydroorotate dehydrogenase/Pyruvate/2-oxoacid:ferredoxin oxidoreductase delta subunit
MNPKNSAFLTDAQLRAELEKCEYCEEKPCKTACPCDCSPADFIMAARVGAKSDIKRAAALIMGSNPLGGVCGAVCPDRHCMKACARATFDHPVNIPAVQATIIQQAKELGVMPAFRPGKTKKEKVAVVGAGPAGLSAAGLMAQLGYPVQVLEEFPEPGGSCCLIPEFRLDPRILKTDLEWLRGLGDVKFRFGARIGKPEELLQKGFDAVIVAGGLSKPIRLGVKGEDLAVPGTEFLRYYMRRRARGKRVAVIGGGAVAADCAESAAADGAEEVELFMLEKPSEMPLTRKEMESLLGSGVQVHGRVRLKRVLAKGKRVTGIRTISVRLPRGKKFHPSLMEDIKGTKEDRAGFDMVVVAVGSRPGIEKTEREGVFWAGDMVNGPTTVVEAAAAGKNAALEADAWLSKRECVKAEKPIKSVAVLPGRKPLPVHLEADFFGRKIISPFLLSAAPPSDGYEQMKKAYQAGWAGGVMKTAFDGVDIHIPGEYMFAFSRDTYANCDNVSGHPLARVCGEIAKLVNEYPDRLTIASTGGPVTGHDDDDRKVWQSNTKKLEAAGAMAVEYSLSCPQGGDGTKGDIVSQDPELTAKIVGWVMEISEPNVPKLFKLTAAVTAIYPIIDAIRQVFAKYPGKKAGVTLANTFPTMAFRKGSKKTWEEGIVVGMSGSGVVPISNLTLANVSTLGVTVSGNGGPMDYRAAADFLALGARTVQFCTVVMKHGYGIVDELHSGLSYLMESRGIKSVEKLIGCALPCPITGFMDLSADKKISDVDRDLCQHCGNCTRCPYLAIELDEEKVPKTDAAKCIGCSICVQKCFSGALFMRERTKKEKSLLSEA